MTDLELEKNELHIPLPVGSPPKYPDYSQVMRLSAKTTAADPEGDVLTYNYTVSGGRVVGTGANVTWDLNLVWPGTYTITAGVDDGCGVCGAKITKSVTVLAHPDTPKCVCWEIRIESLSGKTTSSDLTFSVYISGPQPPGLNYAWTIAEGTIVNGQGTRSIWVRPPEERSGQPVTLSVEVSGLDPTCGCPTTASKTVSFRDSPRK